jgi:hypothetical protein
MQFLKFALTFIFTLLPFTSAIKFDFPKGTVLYNCGSGTTYAFTWTSVDSDPTTANLYQSYNFGDPAAIKLILSDVYIPAGHEWLPLFKLVARNHTRLRFGNAPEQIYAESVEIDVVCRNTFIELIV